MEKKRPNYLGFLTTLGNTRTGLIGGFLILNVVGRPIEFHCTAPIRPNRAQEILYGATLDGFVCGEQVAPALVGRTKLELAAVLTNNPNFLTAPAALGVPFAMVFQHRTRREETSENDAASHYDENGALVQPRDMESKTFFYESLDVIPTTPGVDPVRWRTTEIGANLIALPVSFASEKTGKLTFDEARARVEPFFKFIDSTEPFERIRLAMDEAQRSS